MPASDANADEPRPDVPFGVALRTWAKIGFLSFGGPAGQIALMHGIVVEEKKWVDEAHFLHALNYCMLLPGPEAMQLATYLGWLLHGTRGGLAAGLLFVLPGFVIIAGLSMIYAVFGDAPAVGGLLFGLKAAVVAVVLQALIKLSRRAVKSAGAAVIAVAAFVAIAVFNVPFPAIIVLAALTGFVMARSKPGDGATAGDLAMERVSKAGTVRVIAIWLAVWLVPVAMLFGFLGRDNVLVQEAVFFSTAAMVTFGGAYAVLAYVAQQAVDFYGWLQPDEMLTGLGLAETTPGPLILVLVFVGFLGAWRDPGGLDPVLAGLAGAVTTTWVTFAPCFLWIFAGAPYIERLRSNQALNGAMTAITAAVVGVIANLALWFALHVLFGQVETVALGPAAIPMPAISSFDPAAATIAAAAAIGLLWMRAGMLTMLGLAAAAGIFLKLF